MALMPKRVKHRKNQRGRIKGNASRGCRVSFGDWGLQSLDAGHVNATTIEACRIAANQYIRGEGKLYIRIFPSKPVTARPLETRCHRGVAAPDPGAAVRAGGDPIHTQHRRHSQVQVAGAVAGDVGRREGTGDVQAR